MDAIAILKFDGEPGLAPRVNRPRSGALRIRLCPHRSAGCSTIVRPGVELYINSKARSSSSNPLYDFLTSAVNPHFSPFQNCITRRIPTLLENQPSSKASNHETTTDRIKCLINCSCRTPADAPGDRQRDFDRATGLSGGGRVVRVGTGDADFPSQYDSHRVVRTGTRRDGAGRICGCQAIAHYQDSLTLIEKQNNPENEAAIRYRVGMIYFMQNNYSEAIDTLEMTLALYRQLGDRLNQAHTLRHLAKSYVRAGESRHRVI